MPAVTASRPRSADLSVSSKHRAAFQIGFDRPSCLPPLTTETSFRPSCHECDYWFGRLRRFSGPPPRRRPCIGNRPCDLRSFTSFTLFLEVFQVGMFQSPSVLKPIYHSEGCPVRFQTGRRALLSRRTGSHVHRGFDGCEPPDVRLALSRIPSSNEPRSPFEPEMPTPITLSDVP